MKQKFDGPSAGSGAVYSWAGNQEVGEGRMTILQSRPRELIRIKLEFFEPFAATNTAEFAFKPDDGKTSVTWSMFGENNFMAKALNLIMNMDKLVGSDFERGLGQLGSAAELQVKQ